MRSSCCVPRHKSAFLVVTLARLSFCPSPPIATHLHPSPQRTDDGDQVENDDVDDIDEDDIDEDDDEGFESDVGRDAQARLASDSFLSMRCDSEYFNVDSFSSNAPDEDEEGEEEDEHELEEEDGPGQEEQREEKRASLGGRPRSREYRRGTSNGGGSSSKRYVNLEKICMVWFADDLDRNCLHGVEQI